jgi:hypothetical protein
MLPFLIRNARRPVQSSGLFHRCGTDGLPSWRKTGLQLHSRMTY